MGGNTNCVRRQRVTRGRHGLEESAVPVRKVRVDDCDEDSTPQARAFGSIGPLAVVFVEKHHVEEAAPRFCCDRTAVSRLRSRTTVVAALITAAIVSLPSAGRILNAAAIAGTAVVGLSVMQVWLVPGWEHRYLAAEPPSYALGLFSAVEETHWRSAKVMSQVNQIVGAGDIFVTRDDAVLNVNGLRYFKDRSGSGGLIGAAPYDPAVTKTTVPAEFEFAVTGESCNPYHRNLDREFLESELRSGQWSIAFSLRLSDCNEIKVWRRLLSSIASNAHGLSQHDPAPDVA